MPVCIACIPASSQYGHILGGKFHHSEWGLYLKGGSAYFLVTGLEIYSGGTTGFAAGQGTGFEFMVAPWLQYEAYAIKVCPAAVPSAALQYLGPLLSGPR